MTGADVRSGSRRFVAGTSRWEMGSRDETLRIWQEDSHGTTPSSPPERRARAVQVLRSVHQDSTLLRSPR